MWSLTLEIAVLPALTGHINNCEAQSSARLLAGARGCSASIISRKKGPARVLASTLLKPSDATKEHTTHYPLTHDIRIELAIT